jgi:hypothetical protein
VCVRACQLAYLRNGQCLRQNVSAAFLFNLHQVTFFVVQKNKAQMYWSVRISQACLTDANVLQLLFSPFLSLPPSLSRARSLSDVSQRLSLSLSKLLL